MKRWVMQFITSSLLLCWGLPAFAQVYRCIDSAGNILFTQHHCGPGQHGEVINLGKFDVYHKPKPRICNEVAKLARLVFPHIQQTDSILDIYSKLGGREYLSAGITSAVNYVFSFRYNPKASQANVVSLTHAKCLDGGFGNLTSKDLPDWNKIQYAEAKKKTAKPTKAQIAERHKTCLQYQEKLTRLHNRIAQAKTKSEKMQARLDLEYIEGLQRDKCSTASEKKTDIQSPKPIVHDR